MSATTILGVHTIQLLKRVDERGSLVETFRADELPEGLTPVMSYASYTEPGIGRGPHEHRLQTDIFAFVGPGDFKLYLWDNRSKSASFRTRLVVIAGEDKPTTIIVPPGVVHAYRNISAAERGLVINYPTSLYGGWGKREAVDEIRHEDLDDEFYRDFLT
jgi:dTDP-4-dehydrorhamnose 3,5-epimerase